MWLPMEFCAVFFSLRKDVCHVVVLVSKWTANKRHKNAGRLMCHNNGMGRATNEVNLIGRKMNGLDHFFFCFDGKLIVLGNS